MKFLQKKGLCIYYRNKPETMAIFKMIFQGKDYEFKADHDNPSIIDCGAHIGLATLYFKWLYPKSTIKSIEANPDTFEVLKKNIQANNLENVEAILGAVCQSSEPTLPLYISPEAKDPRSSGASIVKDMWGKQVKRDAVVVPTLRLSSHIEAMTDLVKMDIEGAELEVLQELEQQGKLKLVSTIIIEFHETTKTPKQNLFKIKDILGKSGYSVTEKVPYKYLQMIRDRFIPEKLVRPKYRTKSTLVRGVRV